MSRRRTSILLLLAGLSSACQFSGEGDPGQTVCNVYHRNAAGEPLLGKQVNLRAAESQVSVRAGRVSVRVLALMEAGTPGSLVVAIVDARDRELARGHYQFGDDIRDQFRGGHGFTGLVVWREPMTGAEVQFYCGRG